MSTFIRIFNISCQLYFYLSTSGYTAPYLYMVSMNALEILRVQPYSSPSTPAFHSEKEYVRMNGTGAHIVGKRTNGGKTQS